MEGKVKIIYQNQPDCLMFSLTDKNGCKCHVAAYSLGQAAETARILTGAEDIEFIPADASSPQRPVQAVL